MTFSFGFWIHALNVHTVTKFFYRMCYAFPSVVASGSESNRAHLRFFVRPPLLASIITTSQPRFRDGPAPEHPARADPRTGLVPFVTGDFS